MFYRRRIYGTDYIGSLIIYNIRISAFAEYRNIQNFSQPVRFICRGQYAYRLFLYHHRNSIIIQISIGVFIFEGIGYGRLPSHCLLKETLIGKVHISMDRPIQIHHIPCSIRIYESHLKEGIPVIDLLNDRLQMLDIRYLHLSNSQSHTIQNLDVAFYHIGDVITHAFDIFFEMTDILFFIFLHRIKGKAYACRQEAETDHSYDQIVSF